MSASVRMVLCFLALILVVVEAQRFVDVMMARNEELNGLMNNGRRFGNTNAPTKRNSLLDNLYNIGYMAY